MITRRDLIAATAAGIALSAVPHTVVGADAPPDAPNGWKPASPREEIRPVFACEPQGGPDKNGCLLIRADAREGLYQQVPNPVRWMETIRYLANAGVSRFVEVGAGSVLVGLLKNIDPALSGVSIGSPADLDKLVF